MQAKHKRALCTACGLSALIIGASAVFAQSTTYPNRPIRMIVAFGAGGGTDFAARAVGLKLGEALGQSVIVDNRVGANGAIGAEITARAAPDGHTLMMLSGAQVVAAAYEKTLPYDVARDFAAVSHVVQQPYLLVVSPSLPAQTTQDLIALARAKPGQLNYASTGVAGSTHLVTELFNAAAGIRMTHVPYKGVQPGLTDVAGGQVQIMFSSISSTLPLVRGGKVRALGVTSAKRTPAAPEIPAVAEAVPGYETMSWDGVVAPRNTPSAIVNLLSAAIAKGVQSPDMKERFAANGAEVVGSTPAQFERLIRSELQRFAKVIKDAGIRIE